MRRHGANRRTAEQRDEFPPPHSITSSASESTSGGMESPSALAVLRLITSSNLVDVSTGRSAGFAPLRILRGVDAALAIRLGDAHAIAQESARNSVFAKVVDCGQSLLCGEL